MSNRFFFFNRGNVYRPGDDIDNGNVYSFKSNKVYVPVSTVCSISFATMYFRSPTILNLEAMGDAMFT